MRASFCDGDGLDTMKIGKACSYTTTPTLDSEELRIFHGDEGCYLANWKDHVAEAY